jgi:hypothetical protein
MSNRPEPCDETPVSPEDLAREESPSSTVDLAFDHLDPLLEKIENATDWGFTASQRHSLVERIKALHPGQMTHATYPVRYSATPTDLIMHFGKLDEETIRFRFQTHALLVKRITGFIQSITKSRDA